MVVNLEKAITWLAKETLPPTHYGIFD